MSNIVNANILQIFNWAILKQSGEWDSDCGFLPNEITTSSTLAIIRDQNFLLDIASVQHREHIEEISDEVLIGALQVYLRVYFEPEAKLALEELEAMRE